MHVEDGRKSTNIFKFLGWVLPALLFLILILDISFPITLNKQQFAKVITAEDGTPLRSFADEQGIWRYPIKLSEVSPLYIEALIQYEDRWFWSHPGINPFSITRALLQNLSNNRIVSGGSTLTMQVARLISPHSKSILGKIKQIAIALQLEVHFSKQQILTYYLNHAPFGGTIEGIQAASYTYLGRSAAELSHAEAALLTVLPQSPSRNRPDRHPDRALKVRNKVLRRLAEKKIWSKQIVNQALKEPVIAQHNTQSIIAPLLTRRLKYAMPKQSIINTYINIDMQLGIAELVKRHVQQLPEKTSAAVLIVENKTLKVKAYIGSADFFNNKRLGHVDMVSAIRSPGSTLKPFLYGLAIDEGLIHSQSLLINAPLSFNGYKPQNFSRGYTGPVSVSNSLIKSLNIPAVQVLYHLTPEIFVNRLKNAGLTLQLNQHAKPNLSVILGGVGSNLETLVGTYTALANQGLTGKIRLAENSPFLQQHLFSAGSAWIIQKILSEKSSNNSLAWKTGTSYGHRDFWSIGVTPTYTIGVWVGRPDGTPLPGYYGAYTASPLLFSIVESLVKSSSFKKPDSVIKQPICWPLGGLESATNKDLCHEIKQAWILNNNVPVSLPSHEKKHWDSNPITIQISKKTGLTINNNCNIHSTIAKEIALWPMVIEPWVALKNQRNTQIGQFDLSCNTSTIHSVNEIKIIGLDNNTKLRAAGAAKQLPRIRLQTQGGQGKYYWFINGHLKFSANSTQILFYQFKATGKFQISVIDDAGHSDSINIEVI